MSDYKKGKIYKITNDFNDDIYVGSTCDTLIKRFSSHKRGRTCEHLKHKPLYILMNEIGPERFRIQLIEDYSCEDKYQLRQKEAHYIREIGTLNLLVPFVSATEISERKKLYASSEERKLIRKEENKIFYQKNKDTLIENKKIYYQNNKDIMLEKFKEITKCICGCELRKRDMTRHQKTQKHIKLLNKQNNVEIFS